MQNLTSIDAIDARILKALLKESRTSFTEIAKDCKVSIVAIRMRYNNLKKLGVVNGEIMQVNPYSLGFKCIGTIGINTSINDEKAVLEFLREKFPSSSPYLSWGKYRIGLLVVKKNIREWAIALQTLESNPRIKLVDPLIWAAPTGMDRPENLEIKPLENKRREDTNEQNPTTDNNEPMKIDEIDRQIAKILVQSSRTSFRKIAKQLNISNQQVIQRYIKLRKNLLTLSTITLDLKKLGFNATGSIFVKGERGKMQEICNKILQMPNIITFIRLIGSYDLLAIAALEDFSALIKLQKEMRAMNGIEQVDFFIREIWPAWPLNLFTSHLG